MPTSIGVHVLVIGNLYRIRQIAKLKSSPQFPAIRYHLTSFFALVWEVDEDGASSSEVPSSVLAMEVSKSSNMYDSPMSPLLSYIGVQ